MPCRMGLYVYQAYCALCVYCTELGLYKLCCDVNVSAIYMYLKAHVIVA